MGTYLDESYLLNKTVQRVKDNDDATYQKIVDITDNAIVQKCRDLGVFDMTAVPSPIPENLQNWAVGFFYKRVGLSYEDSTQNVENDSDFDRYSKLIMRGNKEMAEWSKKLTKEIILGTDQYRGNRVSFCVRFT